MGVRGLTTYLHQDSRNFQDYKLHNTTLVIDAANFICQFYLKSTLYTQFNGEYAGLFAVVAEFIGCLKRCAVHPIFVFDGCHQPLKLQTQLRRNKYRLQTCKSLNACINSSSKNVTDESFLVPLVPPLIMSALADALTLLDVQFVTSDRESDPDAISLAIYFNCPVLSDDSDFYITIPESGACLLPICYFVAKANPNSTKCDSCITRKKMCCSISCQKFLPHGPGLNGLPPSLRPLLACLLGNDYIHPQTFSRCFPTSNEESVPLTKAATKSMVLKRRRSLIRALIQWMCNFNCNAEEIIQRLIGRYPTSERPKLRILLDKGMRAYCLNTELVISSFSKYLNRKVVHGTEGIILEDYDSDDHSELAAPLNVNDIESENSSADDYEDPQYPESISNPAPISGQEPTSSDKMNLEEHFVTFSHWPNELIDEFRKYRIMPMFMDPIFSDASVLTCSIESLSDRRSVYLSSTSIRSLIYGLIVGIENCYRSHLPHRLFGVKIMKDRYSVTEYTRIGSTDFKPRKVCIEPINLDKTSYTCNKFIETYLGIPATPIDNEWLKWLAVLVVIYYQSSPEVSSTITSSVTALSFGVIVICSFLNEKYFRLRPKLLRKHYFKCATLLNPTKNKQTKSENHHNRADIHAIHDFGELQVIYIALTSLGSLLDSLTPDKTVSNSRCIPLPSIPVTFPSGYLFHQVYLYIKSFAPSERLACATTLIERILYSDRASDNVPQANDFFGLYISQLDSVLTSLKLSTGKTNQTATIKHVPPVRISERIGRSSRHKHKIPRGKSDQALIEERITRLMLENGLSD